MNSLIHSIFYHFVIDQTSHNNPNFTWKISWLTMIYAAYYSFLAKFMCSSLGLKLIFNHIILLTCSKNNIFFLKQLIFLINFSKTTNFNYLIGRYNHMFKFNSVQFVLYLTFIFPTFLSNLNSPKAI